MMRSVGMLVLSLSAAADTVVAALDDHDASRKFLGPTSVDRSVVPSSSTLRYGARVNVV
jgi:hypothetical protein